jgi:hypothetical protein
LTVPVAEAYLPAAQSRQADCPKAFEYLPASQDEHSSALALE